MEFLCSRSLCSAVARFDFSLGDAEYHQGTLENLKTAIKSTKKLCAVRILLYIYLIQIIRSVWGFSGLSI